MLSRNSTEKLIAYLQEIISIGRYMVILAWQQFYYLSSSANFKTIIYMNGVIEMLNFSQAKIQKRYLMQ